MTGVGIGGRSPSHPEGFSAVIGSWKVCHPSADPLVESREFGLDSGDAFLVDLDLEAVRALSDEFGRPTSLFGYCSVYVTGVDGGRYETLKASIPNTVCQ